MVTRISKLGLTILVLMVTGTIIVLNGPVQAADKAVGDAYPLDYCLVSGAKLGSMGEPVKYDHNGREIRFCCSGCIDGFKKNAETYLGTLDSIIIEQQLPYYPLNTCVVSGEKFGGKMGEPVNKVYNNRLVRFCCPKCTAAFDKDPAAYLSKLDSSVVATQINSYPLSTCVISDGKLGGMGKPVDYVYANRLVRFCCAGCIDAFNEDPTASLAKIDAAMKPKKENEKPKVDKKDKSG